MTVAVSGSMRVAPPVGAFSCTLKVSSSSKLFVSFVSGMAIVLLVSPGPNEREEDVDR